jgi:hypothetical protein
MGPMTWLAMSGNGWRTGTMRVTISGVQLQTPKDRDREQAAQVAGSTVSLIVRAPSRRTRVSGSGRRRGPVREGL